MAVLFTMQNIHTFKLFSFQSVFVSLDNGQLCITNSMPSTNAAILRTCFNAQERRDQ